MPIVGWILFFIISIMIWMIWYFNNTAHERRVFKNNGVERIVKVYDVNGQLIAQYDGKLDITCDGDRILFDDKNGKRHIVYYTTGAVIIDEK